jgi:glycosyltransferase involved in cell wall biosynthesis
MKIGIDISQVAYEKTGVARYVKNLVENLIKIDHKNEYILFFASLRRKTPIFNFQFSNKNQISNSKIQIRSFKIPPILLDFLWNRLHILPIEWLIGDVDVFITSDWTEPPVRKAKKVTILYDLIVFRHPQETAKKIVEVQKRKLKWVKKESEAIICISEATKKDAIEILGIEKERLRVACPGI